MAARWLEVLTAAACGEGGKTEIGTRTLVESKKEGANRGRNSFKKTLKTMVGDTSYGECLAPGQFAINADQGRALPYILYNVDTSGGTNKLQEVQELANIPAGLCHVVVIYAMVCTSISPPAVSPEMLLSLVGDPGRRLGHQC